MGGTPGSNRTPSGRIPTLTETAPLLIYLDTNLVVYLIEQPPGWGARASARLTTLHAHNDHVALSDLTRLECRVRPLAVGDNKALAQYDSFFASSSVRVVGLTAAVCDRAAMIRAAYRFKTVDSLHLAAAV